MGGCYSAIKGMRKENGPAPAPQAAKEETITKPEELPTEGTTLEVGIPSKEEVTMSEVVVTTSEVSVPLKEEVTSEVDAVSFKDADIEEATTKVGACVNEETMESSKVDDKINVKDTKKDEDEEENKDVEKVVDVSKLIEKTLDEETSAKVDVVDDVASKENQKESKDIETMKEQVEVVEEQEKDKQSLA